MFKSIFVNGSLTEGSVLLMLGLALVLGFAEAWLSPGPLWKNMAAPSMLPWKTTCWSLPAGCQKEAAAYESLDEYTG